MIRRAPFLLLIFFLSFIISIPIIIPFFHSGYFPTHDGEWAVVRLGDMFRTLRDFQFPPRYSGNLNFEYGYPLFNFTYPFPYYFGVILHFLGFGFVNAIKFIFAISVLFSAFFMFLLSRDLWKNNWAGTISAILYIYFPYRIVDLYARGSIGESFSFALFPLLFYLALKLIARPSFLLIGCIAVSVACLITTHNIMTVLFMPVYLIFMLIQALSKNKKAIKSFLASILLGIGLAAFFWIPAIFEKRNILLFKIPIADRNLYFVKLEQFIFPRWGYGVPTDPNGFSYQLGLVNFAVFIITIFVLSFLLFKNKNIFRKFFIKTASVLVIFIVFYAFLLFKPSEFLWKNTPLLSDINYPWIALGILGFLISLLAGFLSNQIIGRYISIILGIIAITMVLPYAHPQKYIYYPDSYYLTNNATTTSSNELMPLWVEKIPLQKPEKKIEIIKGTGSIENVFFNSKHLSFSVNVLTKTDIKINTIYYPGWKIYVNNVKSEIAYDNSQGVMEISVPSGSHAVRAIFEETPLRLTSDAISLVSSIVLLAFLIKRNKYAIS